MKYKKISKRELKKLIAETINEAHSDNKKKENKPSWQDWFKNIFRIK